MKIFVADLKPKDSVDEVFLVRTKSSPLAKNGRPYLAMLLGDKSGTIESRMWDNVDAVLPLFETGDYIRVRGSINLYQNRRQLIVNQLQRVSKGEVDPTDFLPTSKSDPEVMMKNLLMIIRGMKNKYLRQLCLDTLEDPEIQARLKRCPAARTIHHAWIGGLLEHTLSICKIMLFMASHYEKVDGDLLLVGAVFHDIGKIWELDYDRNISYTNLGQLVGHLVLGSELIEKKASKISGFPDELKIVCKHLVLSHHGKLEYGSPKLPMTLEAYLVSSIDELDSKVSALQGFLHSEKSRDTEWTGFNSLFDRHFYLGKATPPDHEPEPGAHS